jgi:addiction module RelE/StbE family toxin
MKIFYSKTFEKAFKKLTQKKQQKIYDTIKIFQDNPTHVILKNHQLLGNKKGLRSLSAGGDLRIIFIEENGYTKILMLNVGSHNQVY